MCMLSVQMSDGEVSYLKANYFIYPHAHYNHLP